MLGRLLIYASLVNRINGFPFEPAHEKFQVNVVASHLKPQRRRSATRS